MRSTAARPPPMAPPRIAEVWSLPGFGVEVAVDDGDFEFMQLEDEDCWTVPISLEPPVLPLASRAIQMI